MVTLRKLQEQEAAVAYHRTVLQAWHEIDTALSAYAAYSIPGAILVAIGIASGGVVQRRNVASSDEQILGGRS